MKKSFITSGPGLRMLVYCTMLTGTDANHIYWLGGLDALSNNEWFWSKSAEPLKVRFMKTFTCLK